MSNEPKASPNNTILTMWVLLEGEPASTKFRVDENNYDSGDFNLDDLKEILKGDFLALKDISKTKIEFFNKDDRTTPLDSGKILKSDTTTSKDPLVIRYPLSESCIKGNFRYYLHKGEFKIPHSTGSYIKILQAAKEEFGRLQDINIDNLYFECFQGDSKKGETIGNEFQFNTFVDNIKPNDKKERVIDDLRIYVRGRKAYGDWKLNEVAKIYNYAFSSIDTIRKFKVDDLPKPFPQFEDDELNTFIDELKRKCYVFQDVSANEATAREFISIFLTHAVNYIRKHCDKTTRLAVEVELDGSCGYGNLDYVIFIQLIYALVTEAKMTEMLKGVTQNLVQIYSATERVQKLGKRKHNQTELTDFEESPTIYGIVTTGVHWRFIRCTGKLGHQTIEITDEFNSGLDAHFDQDDADTQGAKRVLSYIVQVLQAQAKEIGRGAKRQKNQSVADNKI